jgi:hypothetical protein
MAHSGGNSGDFYKAGDWLAICDICGFRFKASALRKNWKNEMVCKEDFELRNPQEFIRVRPEKIAAPWVRPEGADVFVGPACFIWDQSAYADLGTADCAKADYTPMSFQMLLDLKFDTPDGSNTNPLCTLAGRSSIAGLGVSGCMVPGYLPIQANYSGIPGYAIPGLGIPGVTFTGL